VKVLTVAIPLIKCIGRPVAVKLDLFQTYYSPILTGESLIKESLYIQIVNRIHIRQQ